MNLSELTDDELKVELARRRNVKEELALPKPLPNPDWTQVTTLAIQIRDEIVRDRREDDDNDVYVSEAVMKAVFGEDYFEWRRTIIK